MTEKTTKIQPEHTDKLGHKINLGDFVAYPAHNSLEFGKVTKLNNKMVKVLKVPVGKYSSERNKYPIDMVRLDEKAMTWYLLKNSA